MSRRCSSIPRPAGIGLPSSTTGSRSTSESVPITTLCSARPDLAEQLEAEEERYARYMPVLRFILLDAAQRLFGAQRMCYLGSIDGWLELGQTGSVAELARVLIPTLGTEQFYELW